MLANTAVPKYYAEFREKVIRGEIPVNREISMEMNRIDALIRNPLYYCDNDAMEGYVEFCEGELTLTDGDDLHLLDTFKLWAEEIFAWYVFEERSVYVSDETCGGHYEKKVTKQRLTNKQYLIIPRANAKSLYETTIQGFFLTVDTSTTHQITTAPTMKQAEEVIGPLKTAITRSRGPYFKFLTYGSVNNTTGNRADRAKLVSTKKGIENFLTGSLLEVRPMSIDKLQGLRCKIATVDEWLSCDIRENVIDTIEQGAAKNPGYLIVAVSSEGTVRNGPGDTIKMELMQLLKGDRSDPHTSIWYYKLDDIAEINDPAMWIKACPNIGITVTYDTYQRDIEKAEKSPAARNDILAKRFNIPMEGYTYFFAYEDTLPHRFRSFWNMPCSMGCDLSRGDDFCAFTFMFPLGRDSFGVKTRSYITERTLTLLSRPMRQKYDEFMKEGTLIVMPGVTLKMDEVYDDLQDFIEKQRYDVRTVGYDPYNAEEFIKLWSRDYGEFGVTKVIQGSKTESVPLGDLKHLAEERQLLFDESIMQFAMGNCIALVDTNGNRKLLKQRYDQKIDNVAAMMDAYVAYTSCLEAFE